MKKLLVLSISILAIGLQSCDKVSNPRVIQTTLDTTLYPGNFVNYVPPTFGENTNTDKNVLIEDFTGHKCTFCPAAATTAKNLEDANPGRVYTVSIHGGPHNSGISDFQKAYPGEPKYYTDHTNAVTREIASTFFQMGVGFNSNPQGTINRITESGEMFFNHGLWGDKVAEQLPTTLKVNIQAQSNYFPETNGVFIHTQTEFLENMDGDYNIVIYCIQNEVIDWQLDAGTDVENYHHHNVHIGNVYDETWGRAVATGQISAGTKIEQEFSYKVPDGLTNNDMHFIIYVYDKATYEILQVIENDF